MFFGPASSHIIHRRLLLAIVAVIRMLLHVLSSHVFFFSPICLNSISFLHGVPRGFFINLLIYESGFSSCAAFVREDRKALRQAFLLAQKSSVDAKLKVLV